MNVTFRELQTKLSWQVETQRCSDKFLRWVNYASDLYPIPNEYENKFNLLSWSSHPQFKSRKISSRWWDSVDTKQLRGPTNCATTQETFNHLKFHRQFIADDSTKWVKSHSRRYTKQWPLKLRETERLCELFDDPCPDRNFRKKHIFNGLIKKLKVFRYVCVVSTL